MIYLTGCTGFIGNRLVKKFEELGIMSVGISKSKCLPDLYPNHKCDSFDLLSGKNPRYLFEDSGSVLIHLSWIATPGLFWNSLENITWSIKSKLLFDSFFTSGGSKLINVGSSAEYVSGGSISIAENEKIGGGTLYGRSKGEVSIYLEQKHADQFTNLRVFNLYGLNEKSGRFIPDCIDSLSQGKSFSVHNPKQVRDFIFVDDLVDTILLCLRSGPTGHLNVGTGVGTTLDSVAGLIGRHLGASHLIVSQSSSQDDSRVVASIVKFNEFFPNFKITNIEDGIIKSISARSF
jgi:nucleoside-diphosphate-sugar epimerase